MKKMQSSVSEMFDQAVESFDTALRSGVKIQEEATRWWSDMMLESESIEDLQQRMRTIMNDTLPITHRNIEQYMQIFDRTYRTGMEMLKKAFEMSQSESIAAAQVKTQELWEASLAMLRNNAQSIVQLNARAMELWAEFARKDLAAQAAQAGTAAAQRAGTMAQTAARGAEQATREAMGEAERMAKRTAAAQRTAAARQAASGRAAATEAKRPRSRRTRAQG